MSQMPGVQQQYPKAMVHPHERKAVTIKTGEGRNAQYNGTPDMYPPVTVTNAEQEGQHRALGYIVRGEPIEPGAHQEFPMWLSHPTLTPALVNTEGERDAKMAEGYTMAGKSDPVAFQKSAAMPYVPGRVIQEWPKMVNGKIVDPNAAVAVADEYPKWIGGAKGRIVNNAAEEKALLASMNPQQAPEPVSTPVPTPSPEPAPMTAPPEAEPIPMEAIAATAPKRGRARTKKAA